MAAMGRLAVDVVLLNLATVVTVLARLDFREAPWPWVYTLRFPGVAENLVFVAASILLQTPLTLWSYSSLRDVMRVALVVRITKVLALPLLMAMSGEVQWSRGAFAAAARSRWPPTWRCELGMAKMRFPPLLVAILDPYAWEESCRSCRSREILPVALEEVGQRVRRGDMEESMRNVLVV